MEHKLHDVAVPPQAVVSWGTVPICVNEVPKEDDVNASPMPFM